MPPEPDAPPPEADAPRVHASRVVRGIYVALGGLCLGLGIIGGFVPLLPTTVFILLAAYFFARSSTRFYTALIRDPRFGPIVRNWEEHRCISRQSRIVAISLILLSFGLTTGFAVTALPLRLGLVALGIALVVYLARLPTCEADPP